MTDKLIMLVPQDLKEKLLQKADLNFDEALKMIKAHETAKYQAKELQGEKIQEFNVNQVNNPPGIICHRCGSKFHKVDSRNCPAKM